MAHLTTSINSDYHNDMHSWDEITRQLRNIAAAGFTHIQWIHDWDGDYMYSDSEIAKAARLLRDLHLNAHTLHASEGCVRVHEVNGKRVFDHRYRFREIRKDYTSEDEDLRRAGVDLIMNRIRLCEAIGAHAMVLHMQLPYRFFRDVPGGKERYYDAVCRSIEDLLPHLAAADVRIAFENLPGTPMADMEACFDLIFSRFAPDHIGFCYDSGHATLQHTHDPLYFIQKYNDRLYATHLQDNDSIIPKLMDDDIEFILHDRHRVPFTGVCDWEGIAKAVATAPLDLPADFEVGICGETEEEEMELLVDCRERAEKFHQMVLSYQQ